MRAPRPAQIAIVLLVLLCGCAQHSWVRVRHVPDNPLDGPLQLLSPSGPTPTERTMLLVRRYGLEDDLDECDTELLPKLREIAHDEPSPEKLYAMAEVSYLAGKRAEPISRRKALEYHGLAVVNAYHYLFDDRFGRYKSVVGLKLRSILCVPFRIKDETFGTVYLDAGDGQEFLLGETDSEGFLDELAQNGETYRYFVSAVDRHGHESAGGGVAAGTPRPDFHGEWVYAFGDEPALSGFRFETDEGIDPIVLGTDPSRAFRLEVDAFGWWLVPGPGASIYPQGFVTTALKCGVAADAGCVDVVQAPTSGYQAQDVSVESQTSYVFQVVADDGLTHYGVIRVELLGFDQDDRALMIFDWAYQSQADNPNLADVVGVPLR